MSFESKPPQQEKKIKIPENIKDLAYQASKGAILISTYIIISTSLPSCSPKIPGGFGDQPKIIRRGCDRNPDNRSKTRYLSPKDFQKMQEKKQKIIKKQKEANKKAEAKKQKAKAKIEARKFQAKSTYRK